MSIICIALLKVCPRSLLESWLRWLKNLMYKNEGLSLYPQKIQQWLCIPLIPNGGTEGWGQTDPGQSDEKNKTKAKQTSKQRVFQVQREILHQRNKTKSNRAGHQKFSSGLQVHACAHRQIYTRANALSSVDTYFIAYQFSSHSINQACTICILWYSEWSFMPWSYIQRLFTSFPQITVSPPDTPHGFLFFPQTYKSRKKFFLDFSHSFPMSNLSYLFLFVWLWKSSLSLVQPLLLRPIHYDRLCLDL